MDFAAIQNDKAVVSDVECYAHGGMLYSIDSVLSGFLIKKEGVISVDRTVSKDLPRRVMQYVFETAAKG